MELSGHEFPQFSPETACYAKAYRAGFSWKKGAPLGLVSRAKVAGASSIALAADRAALAAILDGLCSFEESQKLYRQALKTYRRVYGKSHREIALILNNSCCNLPGDGATESR